MVIGIILAVGLGIWFDLGRWTGFVLAVLLCSPGVLLGTYKARTVRVSAYDQETVTFSFKRSEDAQEFMRANRIEVEQPAVVAK